MVVLVLRYFAVLNRLEREPKPYKYLEVEYLNTAAGTAREADYRLPITLPTTDYRCEPLL